MNNLTDAIQGYHTRLNRDLCENFDYEERFENDSNDDHVTLRFEIWSPKLRELTYTVRGSVAPAINNLHHRIAVHKAQLPDQQILRRERKAIETILSRLKSYSEQMQPLPGRTFLLDIVKALEQRTRNALAELQPLIAQVQDEDGDDSDERNSE